MVTLLYDGNDNSMYNGKSGEDEFSMYKLGDEYISCSAGACFRLPDGNAGTATISEDQYSFSDEDLISYRNNAEYQGTAQCGDQTCDKWYVASDDFTGTFYVDPEKKIQKVEGQSDERTWMVEFDYKPVTITRPENVQDSPLI